MAVIDLFAQWISGSYEQQQGAVMTELPTPIEFERDGSHPKLRWRLVDIHRANRPDPDATVVQRNRRARRVNRRMNR